MAEEVPSCREEAGGAENRISFSNSFRGIRREVVLGATEKDISSNGENNNGCGRDDGRGVPLEI